MIPWSLQDLPGVSPPAGRCQPPKAANSSGPEVALSSHGIYSLRSRV